MWSDAEGRSSFFWMDAAVPLEPWRQALRKPALKRWAIVWRPAPGFSQRIEIVCFIRLIQSQDRCDFRQGTDRRFGVGVRSYVKMMRQHVAGDILPFPSRRPCHCAQ